MNYGFIIDNRKCIGCHACTVACKAEHQTPVGVNRTWVKYIEKGEFPNTRRHFSVMRCNHCDDAPCIEICPVTALFRRDDGIVDFDQNRCIGCKACMQACPYDALYIDPETHTAAKCNYCAHRVDVGLEPACVNVCPEHAIISGDLDDPDSEIARLLAREQVTVRKPEKGTRPKLYYIEADQASLRPTLTEQSASYMWSSQAWGVGHYARYARDRSGRSDPDQMLVQLSTSPAGQWLENKTNDFVTNGGDPKKIKESARRVYDAPAKGAVWGWEVSAYLWTKSIAAGAFVVPFFAWSVFGTSLSPETRWLAVIVALVFLGLTGLLLVKDLDRPDRFLYVLLRPQWKSWLVRGAYLITLYGIILALWIGAELLKLSAFQHALHWPGIVFGILTAVYTAFLFAQAKGRDFWQSPMLSLHFLAHAVMAGASVLAIAALVQRGDGAWVEVIRTSLAVGMLAHLSTLGIELAMPHATDDARRTAHSIVRGRFSVAFWSGAIVVGNLLPLILIWFGGTFSLGAAGILILIGIYIAQHIWVKAPQLIPLS